MVYINSEGTVGGTRKRRGPFRFIADFIAGIFDFIGLFFRTLTASPTALEAERVSSLVLIFCAFVAVLILDFSYFSSSGLV